MENVYSQQTCPSELLFSISLLLSLFHRVSFICSRVIPIIGFTLILIVSPVAADLSAVVEEKERADPNAFGPGGAYAQAFALFNCSMAAGTLFGPVVAGAIIERHGWGAMTAAMGIFAFSGAIPAVSAVVQFSSI